MIGLTRNVFAMIEEKQDQYYRTLPKQLRELISSVEGADIIFKGQKAMVKCIYTDSTADIIVLDEQSGEESEVNVQLSELY